MIKTLAAAAVLSLGLAGYAVAQEPAAPLRWSIIITTIIITTTTIITCITTPPSRWPRGAQVVIRRRRARAA